MFPEGVRHCELSVDLTPCQAQSLAQLCKRITFSEIQANAVDMEEAYVMLGAIVTLAEALAAIGYAPR
jgi:hypothetical protein